MLRTPELTGDKVATLVGQYGIVSSLPSDPLVVSIIEEEGHTVYKEKGIESDAFAVELASKKGYWICIENHSHDVEFEDDETRKVGFSYDVDIKSDNENTVNARSKDWQQHSHKLMQELHGVQEQLAYLKVRERDHRQVTERNFTSVLWWTLLELAMVILAAMGQVWYLKRFVESKPMY